MRAGTHRRRIRVDGLDMEIRAANYTEARSMKHHIDGEVKWVWILTTLIPVYIVTLLAI